LYLYNKVRDTSEPQIHEQEQVQDEPVAAASASIVTPKETAVLEDGPIKIVDPFPGGHQVIGTSTAEPKNIDTAQATAAVADKNHKQLPERKPRVWNKEDIQHMWKVFKKRMEDEDIALEDDDDDEKLPSYEKGTVNYLVEKNLKQFAYRYTEFYNNLEDMQGEEEDDSVEFKVLKD
jgi:hypothetical protein